MEQKTKIVAEDGTQEMVITREFDLPLELLFKAYEDAELVEEWMGTKVLKLESRKHGSYQLEKSDDAGKVIFRAHGVIHDLVPNKKMVRTFEMENVPVGVQLEVYEFERITDEKSKLHMHVVYESVAQRDQVIQMGMTWGINMAHDRIQEIVGKRK